MRKLTLAGVVFLAVATHANATEKWQVQAWVKQLEKTSTLLKEGRHAQALPILRRLNSEMLEAFGPGDETTYALVVPLIQTALAEVGSGDEAAGLWHWHMAQTLFPKSAESDLTAFGAAAEVLKTNILPIPRPEKCPPPDEEVSPPHVLSRTEPKYPRGMRSSDNQGIVIVTMKVRVDGTPTEPRVVKPLATPLTYAVLDALRLWRFAPATVNGAPIQRDFCLTVNFKLK